MIALMRYPFLLMLLLAAPVVGRTAEVRAWLDRDTMQLGETVTLNVEISDTATSEQPDFNALKQDFQLLGTSSSSSINIVNGTRSAKLLWAIGLEPKHDGTIVIPALAVAGASTAPITLKVLPAPSGASGKQGDDVYLEINAEPRNPYVQQQVRYSVKLYYAINLTEGNLEEPHADGLVARKLGQDQNYQAMVASRRYHVLERHYALTAEKSGALTLPPIGFRGRAIDAGDVNGFFGRGRSLSAHSDSVELDVRARPAGSGAGAWLPAKDLGLTTEGIDNSVAARVGEPITLTVRLKAQGLGHEQLPELELPHIEGADVYPDKAVTQTRDNDGWLYGERERKFAIVPTRAGKLALPAIHIDWWDTEHDRAASAELPAQEVEVQPALATTAAVSPVTPANATPSMPAKNQTPETAVPALVGDHYWRMLALSSFGLWVVSAGAFLMRAYLRRRTKITDYAQASKQKSNAEKMKFRVACSKTNLTLVTQALLAWAQSERPELRNLGELAAMSADENQRSALAALERARYGGVIEEGIAARLRDAFATGFSFVRANSEASVNPSLPPLYPVNAQREAS